MLHAYTVAHLSKNLIRKYLDSVPARRHPPAASADNAAGAAGWADYAAYS